MKISIDHLVKRFGGVTAIDDLSIEVVDGEFLVLLGPSGCGKTTTLRILAGLEVADSGHVFIGDDCVDSLAPKDRDIAMVFQDYALYPYMTVYDNIAFPLRVRKKLTREEIDRSVREAARLLRIESLLLRRPSETSGGEQQRVAVARAIVRRPRAFFMDEPLSNIDAKFRVQMRAELQLLHRQLGVTTVCVSHDQMDAMTLGTRIAVMDRGKLRQIGPPKEVYAKPADLFVAGFLGTPPINFLSATITAWDKLTLLTGNGGTNYPIDNGLASALGHRDGTDTEVVLAVRPEKLRLGPAPSSGFGIRGRVYVVEAVGADQYAYVELGPDVSVILRADPELDLRVDEPVVISWDARDALVFDRVTTNRVWPQ